MARWPWSRVEGGRHTQGRTTGAPPSANGASSMHLRWQLAGPVVSAEVDLEVIEAPSVPALYFWALQVDVTRSGVPVGGAHLGLQWHPSYPSMTAVNWGGYHAGGGELSGTDSTLPSALGNPNTRDYDWRPGRRYRLIVERSPGAIEGSWRGSVRDVDAGATTVVRDLHLDGDAIAGVVMWSEVFARCDDPPASVRWSSPAAFDASGARLQPAALVVNYQSERDGGCSNTTSFGDEAGVIQRTRTERITAQGTRLAPRGGSG